MMRMRRHYRRLDDAGATYRPIIFGEWRAAAGGLCAPRYRKAFAVMLLASIVTHAAAFIAMPRDAQGDPKPAPVLTVMFARPPAPVRIADRTPPPRVEPPREPRQAPVQPRTGQRPAPSPATATSPPAPKPLLALAPEDAVAAPTTTVPVRAEPQPPAAPMRAAEAALPHNPSPTRPATSDPPVAPASFTASYLRNAPPRYPLIARRNSEEGTVKLKVRVTPEGLAAEVNIDHTSGSAALDRAAIEAVKGWQFVPARRGDEPLESWVIVPLVFRLASNS